MAEYLTQFKCSKLTTAPHLKALIEGKKLDRDIPPLDCDTALVERVISNYIIVRNILSHLSWQELELCKLVCKSWKDAVKAQRRATMEPRDFVLTEANSHTLKFVKSAPMNNEPLIIFSFVLVSTLGLRAKCEHFSPSVCDPPCTEEHDVIDVIDHSMNSPKECMVTVKTDFITYMPVATSPTSLYSGKKQLSERLPPFIGGFAIPKLPDVNSRILKVNDLNLIEEEFYTPVNDILKKDYIKGILVFVTDKYFLHSMLDISFLDHFRVVQPDVPFALGGCIIEDTLLNRDEISALIGSINEEKPYISDNTISICLFTVPKDNERITKNNFEMYSLVVENTESGKKKLVSALKEFSERIPRFQHSVAMKLSCMGLESRHHLELAVFRAFFPDTPLIGCFGNGELGVNHPMTFSGPPQKRRRKQPSIMYSYTSVYVYFGWGKILE